MKAVSTVKITCDRDTITSTITEPVAYRNQPVLTSASNPKLVPTNFKDTNLRDLVNTIVFIIEKTVPIPTGSSRQKNLSPTIVRKEKEKDLLVGVCNYRPFKREIPLNDVDVKDLKRNGAFRNVSNVEPYDISKD